MALHELKTAVPAVSLLVLLVPPHLSGSRGGDNPEKPEVKASAPVVATAHYVAWTYQCPDPTDAKASEKHALCVGWVLGLRPLSDRLAECLDCLGP